MCLANSDFSCTGISVIITNNEEDKNSEKNLWNSKKLKLKNKVRVKKRKVKFNNLKIIEIVLSPSFMMQW